eukprot:TRINITY_DN10541_c0_g1_i1.p1 TRINITY_DN10541_c0_g1~~TRINITY_DN10541_c0_g1_i1.p1  ORF type:complete len:670 (-),score=86.25 TRINITY_DN10541_c0_g1_i1:259-2268(-)
MKALKYIITACLILCGTNFSWAALPAAEQTFLQNFHAAMTALPALNWNISNVANACTLGWEGISCGPDLGGGTRRIIGFSLRSRSLSGVLPATIKDLSSLVLLDLSHNQISGTLPAGFENLPLADIAINGNFLSCPTVAPSSSLNVANIFSCDVSGNNFCVADTQPNTPSSSCSALFPASVCRITYCRVSSYLNVTGTGVSLSASSGTASFIASGTKPEFRLSVSSPAAALQCTIGVTEVLQTGTTAASNINSGLGVQTNRSVDLLSKSWLVESKSTSVSGKATTDVHYSTFIAQGKRVIIHATMSEQSISLPFYDGSVSLSPLSIKFSVEIHNFGVSSWPVTITGKYLAATMKLSCNNSFSITPSTAGTDQNLNLNFPTSGGLLSGRLHAILEGSADDSRSSNVFFGYADPANKTAAETGTTPSVFFRLHVQDANNNIWIDPDLTLSIVAPPAAPTPVANPQAVPATAPSAAPIDSSQPQAAPTPSSEPTTAPQSAPTAGGAAPSGIIIAPFGIIGLPPTAVAGEPPTNATSATPTGDGGGNNNNSKPGLSGANIALIVFAVVLVVLIVAIILAVKWPKIKKAIEKRRAERQQRQAAHAMARLNALQPANAAPAPAPAPAPVTPLAFAPPTSGMAANAQAASPDPNLSPRSWAKARKSKLNLVNTEGK